jgi:hypothetical protein
VLRKIVAIKEVFYLGRKRNVACILYIFARFKQNSVQITTNLQREFMSFMNIRARRAVVFFEVSLKSGWGVFRDNTVQNFAYLVAEYAICNIITALWESNLKTVL